MAFGNNRSGKQARAHFQLAGGSIIKFKHPYLAGQLSSNDSTIDEIDISACVKLEGRYFEATPNQDSARQVVLVDGSVSTITNKLLNGTITMPVVRTTGIVAEGDFISALQLIKATGDTVGGLLYKTDYVNGKAITTLYYGVTVQRIPDDISEGNDVPVYNVQLLYAGWIQAVASKTDTNKKAIWAVGSEAEISAYFSPYKGQNADGNGATDASPMSTANVGISDKAIVDDTSANSNVTTAVLTASKKYVDTLEEVTTDETVEVSSRTKPSASTSA